jgi:hypothetical protein
MVAGRVSSLRIKEVKNLIFVIVLYTIIKHKIDINMRMEDFLGRLNAALDQNVDLLKILIGSVLLLLAHQFFFYQTLVLLLIGIPAYVYVKTYGQAQVDQLYRDLASIAGTKNTATASASASTASTAATVATVATVTPVTPIATPAPSTN